MLSRKAKYALKALIGLAKAPPGNPVRIADLARRERIPAKFLELILLELRNRGVLQSRKGKGGGYLLSKDPRKINIGDLVRHFDGPLAPVPCASQTAYARCQDCRDEAGCGVRWVMKEVRDATARILDRTTLADLMKHDAGAGALSLR
jgi:Rrf2 family protein